jgi:hypothetical protein
MSREIIEFDPFDPKKIYNDLINRCKKARTWNIRCIVDESWVGLAPFNIMIVDGIFHCMVVSPTLKEAYLLVSEKLPVIRFLDYKKDEE